MTVGGGFIEDRLAVGEALMRGGVFKLKAFLMTECVATDEIPLSSSRFQVYGSVENEDVIGKGTMQLR